MLQDDSNSVEVIEDEILEGDMLGAVGSIVWNDFDKDGFMGENDLGVQGVKVTLYIVDTNEATIYTSVTDVDGKYLIENVEPGEYYAVFDPGPDYEFIFEGGLVDSIGRSKVFTLGEGETKLTINAPIIKNTGSIKGKVFKDIEIGKSDTQIAFEGKSVILLNEKGKLEERTTNELGVFSFNSLVDGKYTLVFNDTENYRCITSKGVEIVIKDGAHLLYANAIYEKININYSIEGRVFVEKALNGVLELRDTLVNGIIVEIYNGENLIKRTLTGSINGIVGIYRFENLSPSIYEVRFVLPSGGAFGKRQNIPYGSKVNEETGRVKINLQNRDEIDVNAAINIK